MFLQVRDALEDAWLREPTDDEAVLGSEGYAIAPDACRNCGAILRPHQMTLTHGSGKPDATPFFHFALAFEGLRKPDNGTARMDPALLEVCWRTCSVPFRSTERWE